MQQTHWSFMNVLGNDDDDDDDDVDDTDAYIDDD